MSYRTFPHATKLVALLSISLAIGCTPKTEIKESTPKAEREFTVVLEPVVIQPQTTRVEAVGTSEAVRSITIYPESAGEVTSVNFKPDQLVQAGDVLLTLESRDETLAVELAAVRLAEAQRLHKRYVESAATGATLPTTLDAAKATLDAARIALDRAKIALDDRSVTAPFTGHVGITTVEVGDRIQPSTVITSLDDRSSLLVSFDVPEMMVGQLTIGDDMQIATWSTGNTEAVGEVFEIDSRINPNTRTFVTRAIVVNDKDQLRPGMSFRVTLDVVGNAYPILPEIALQWGANGSYIWTATEGVAHRVPVDIVQRQQGKVLVKSNLQPGDLVVVEGLQTLRPGIHVKADRNIASKQTPRGGRG